MTSQLGMSHVKDHLLMCQPATHGQPNFSCALVLCVQGIAICVVTSRAYMAAALKLLGELTYPSPRGIARLTMAVLLSSAALTLVVYNLDQAYMRTLLPPIARKLARM